MPFMPMSHDDEDPADTIRKKIGSLEGFTLFGNQVLLGVYERPQKTKSGIFISDQTRNEDRHQGKAGLVLLKGPTAFISDANYDFKGQNVDIGDWVAIFVSDGRAITIAGQLARIVEDQYVRLKIPAPDVVF